MTVQEYWDKVRACGVRGVQRGKFGTNYIGTTRDGQVTSIPDPDPLSPEERDSVIEKLKARHGIEH